MRKVFRPVYPATQTCDTTPACQNIAVYGRQLSSLHNLSDSREYTASKFLCCETAFSICLYASILVIVKQHVSPTRNTQIRR
jgi:hypothetical protein